MENRGLVHVYYGDGKGKTTAALGLMLRALGHGKKAALVQFLKGAFSGEIAALGHLSGILVLRGQCGEKFFFQMTEEEKRETRRIHDEHLAQALGMIKSGEYDVLVLDEALDACALSALDTGLLAEILNHGEGRPEIVITGHQPVDWILDQADYITEMVSKKHPYDKGIKARKGIEWVYPEYCVKSKLRRTTRLESAGKQGSASLPWL